MVELEIEGPDGYRLEGHSTMAQISRDPLELVRQAMSEHQYPDGFVLFLGTLFAPTQDRDEPGRGFTHKVGDRGHDLDAEAGHAGQHGHHLRGGAGLDVRHSRALMRNLAARGLLNNAAVLENKS